MKGILFVFVVSALATTCFSKAVYNKEVWRAIENGAEFDVIFRVVDDDGFPVANARCGGWMYVEHDRKHGCGYAVYTDTNGCARVTGKCGEVLSVVVRKDGYYKTSFDVKYPLENVSSPIVNGKWQPYGETRTVVLKKISNPACCCVFPNLRRCRIPEFGSWIGFDFKQADWVAPYGRGVCRDVLLRFVATEKMINDYKYEMEVSFTNNPYAGAYLLKEDDSSDLTTVRVADSNALYRTSFVFVKEQTPGTSRHWDFLDSGSYLVFRTRTRVDERGNLIGAHYGKIRGQWLSELEFMILSDGCFNQEENDVNIEDGRTLRDVLRNYKRIPQ